MNAILCIGCIATAVHRAHTAHVARCKLVKMFEVLHTSFHAAVAAQYEGSCTCAQAALADLDAAVAAHPCNVRALMMRGNVKRQRGDLQVTHHAEKIFDQQTSSCQSKIMKA